MSGHARNGRALTVPCGLVGRKPRSAWDSPHFAINLAVSLVLTLRVRKAVRSGAAQRCHPHENNENTPWATRGRRRLGLALSAAGAAPRRASPARSRRSETAARARPGGGSGRYRRWPACAAENSCRPFAAPWRRPPAGAGRCRFSGCSLPWPRREERQHPRPPQTSPHHHRTVAINAVHPEHRLGNIQPDHTTCPIALLPVIRRSSRCSLGGEPSTASGTDVRLTGNFLCVGWITYVARSEGQSRTAIGADLLGASILQAQGRIGQRRCTCATREQDGPREDRPVSVTRASARKGPRVQASISLRPFEPALSAWSRPPRGQHP